MRFLSCLSLFLIAGCVTVPRSDQASIVGTWTDETRSFEKTYFADGTSCGSYKFVDPPHDPNYIYSFRSTWQLKDKVLTSTVITSDDADLTPGSVFVDHIDSFHPDKFFYRADDSSDTEVRYRVLPTRSEADCKV